MMGVSIGSVLVDRPMRRICAPGLWEKQSRDRLSRAQRVIVRLVRLAGASCWQRKKQDGRRASTTRRMRGGSDWWDRVMGELDDGLPLLLLLLLLPDRWKSGERPD
jgi:hypothetical protein